VGPRDAAIVHGAGPVGLAVIAELHRLGVPTIVASDFSPRRRATALAMGATLAVDPAVDEPVDAWQRGGGGGAPVVFDAIGVPGSLGLAIRSAPATARVVVVGSCMQQDTIRPVLPQLKQLTIAFSFAYDPFEFADTLRAVAEGEIDVTPMITGVCGIDGVAGAFTALGSPEEHVKILVEPGAPAAITPV
jgi:threonine dehydrogenase-like Zn-dependent dehydrogenase